MPVEEKSVQDVPHTAGKDEAEPDHLERSHFMDIPDHINEKAGEDRQRQNAQQPKTHRGIQIVRKTKRRPRILHIQKPKGVVQVGAHLLIAEVDLCEILGNFVPTDKAQGEQAEEGDSDRSIAKKTLPHNMENTNIFGY